MNWFLKLLSVCWLLVISIESSAQLDQFYIGMGVMDFDGAGGAQNHIGCDQQYLEDLADLNFNMVLPYHQLLKKPTKWYNNSPAPSRAFLDRAQNLGISVIMNLPECSFDPKEFPGPNEEMDLWVWHEWLYNNECPNALQYWGNHPAVIGFHICDELRPIASDGVHWARLDDYSKDIAAYDNTKIRFANFFGMGNHYNKSTPSDPYAGYNSLKASLDDIIANSPEVNLISTDNYPFRNKKCAPKLPLRQCGGLPARDRYYFQELDALASWANTTANAPPYFHIFTPLENYKPNPSDWDGATTEELKYQIFAALTYGVKSLFYWARETETGCGGGYSTRCSNSLSSGIGTKVWDQLIDQSTREDMGILHSKILNIGDILFDLKFGSAYHKSEICGREGYQYSEYHEPLLEHMMWTSENVMGDPATPNSHDPIAIEYFDFPPGADPISPVRGSVDHIVISFLEDSKGDYYFWIFNKDVYGEVQVQLDFKSYVGIVDILNNQVYDFDNSHIIELGKAEGKLFQLSHHVPPNHDFCGPIQYDSPEKDVFGDVFTIGGPSCLVEYMAGADIDYYGNVITLAAGNNATGVRANKGSHLVLKAYNPTPTYLRKGQLPPDEGLAFGKEFELFPNPTSGSLTIRYDPDLNPYRIEFRDKKGTEIRSLNGEFQTNNEGEIDLDLRQYSKGMYFISLFFENEKVTKKLIIE